MDKYGIEGSWEAKEALLKAGLLKSGSVADYYMFNIHGLEIYFALRRIDNKGYIVYPGYDEAEILRDANGDPIVVSQAVYWDRKPCGNGMHDVVIIKTDRGYNAFYGFGEDDGELCLCFNEFYEKIEMADNVHELEFVVQRASDHKCNIMVGDLNRCYIEDGDRVFENWMGGEMFSDFTDGRIEYCSEEGDKLVLSPICDSSIGNRKRLVFVMHDYGNYTQDATMIDGTGEVLANTKNSPLDDFERVGQTEIYILHHEVNNEIIKNVLYFDEKSGKYTLMFGKWGAAGVKLIREDEAFIYNHAAKEIVVYAIPTQSIIRFEYRDMWSGWSVFRRVSDGKFIIETWYNRNDIPSITNYYIEMYGIKVLDRVEVDRKNKIFRGYDGENVYVFDAAHNNTSILKPQKESDVVFCYENDKQETVAVYRAEKGGYAVNNRKNYKMDYYDDITIETDANGEMWMCGYDGGRKNRKKIIEIR